MSAEISDKGVSEAYPIRKRREGHIMAKTHQVEFLFGPLDGDSRPIPTSQNEYLWKTSKVTPGGVPKPGEILVHKYKLESVPKTSGGKKIEKPYMKYVGEVWA